MPGPPGGGGNGRCSSKERQASSTNLDQRAAVPEPASSSWMPSPYIEAMEDLFEAAKMPIRVA